MNGEPTGWNLELIGIAWWLVVPLAILAGWGAARLLGLEVARLPRVARRGLTWLRSAAVVTAVLLLLEPTLTHTTVERELPSVAVLIDRSGSMAVTDAQMPLAGRLDEAVALGLIDTKLRPEGPRRARRALGRLTGDLPSLNAAVVAAQEAWTHGRVAQGRDQAVHLAEFHATGMRELSGAVSGDAAADALFKSAGETLTRVAALVRRERADAGAEKPEAVVAALGRLGESIRALLPKLDAAQETSDRQLLGRPDAGPVKDALAQLAGLSRFERGRRVAHATIVPQLSGRGEVKVFAVDDGGLTPIEDLSAASGPAPIGTTDYASPFSTLARTWAETRQVGAVVMISDGRQTAGVDPVPAIRALAARGAKLAGVLVGDAGQIRDAVVGEVQAPAEVFRGETVRLDVRLRIAGFKDRDWNLILTQDGKEIERRTLKGTGAWQVERFEIADAKAGVHSYQARVERVGGRTATGGGLSREMWNNVIGFEVRDLVNHGPFKAGKPDATDVVPQASVNEGSRENYGQRLRGWVVPPATGSYVFAVSADDKAELWLSPSADPQAKTKIADVPDWVEPTVWDKYQTQRSQPVALEKGKAYYIEVLHKQASGGGHVSVGWTLPDQRVERPIPGAVLTPFGKDAPVDGKDDQPEASLANNQAESSVTVNDDPMKVLVVDSSPRWESRYLVNMFERDRRVEVVRRYHAIRQPRGERELLPRTQEELDAFDLVVLGDLAPGEVGAEDQQRLERFVSRRGGFVVVVAGPRGMPASYALGGIANLLPVRVVGGSGDGAPLPVELSRAGVTHPITAVLDDQTLNQKLWPLLPPLEWVARGVAAKPGADVLLTAADGAKTPVVAASRYGAGRVLWVGSPETWRWRDRLGDRVHESFWLQAVRWGLGIRLRGKDARLQAALDRALIAPREAVELRVRARRADGTAVDTAPHATVIKLDEKGEPIAASARELDLGQVADADALWHVTLSDLPEGRWRVKVRCAHPDLDKLEEVRDLIVRAHQSQEGIELGADGANLARLAEAGNYRADTLDQAGPLIRDLAARLEPRTTPHRTTHSLWDNYLALLVVVGLLAIEWVWRKRVGLP